VGGIPVGHFPKEVRNVLLWLCFSGVQKITTLALCEAKWWANKWGYVLLVYPESMDEKTSDLRISWAVYEENMEEGFRNPI
jgi:hypothetical protein